MKIIPCVQGDAAWFEARCGHVSSSRIADAIAVLKKKEGEAAVRRHLRMAIVSERLTERHADHYVSKPMEWGTENEPLARTAYEMKTDRTVDLLGYVLHPTIEYAGASPDGLVGKDGCIEVKCPNTATHIDYLIAGQVPEDYQPQCLWVMACTGRQWCDFVSFDPRLPMKYQLFMVRMQRDEERIRAMEAEVRKFLGEVEALIKRLGEGEEFLANRMQESIAGFGITQAETDAVIRGELR